MSYSISEVTATGGNTFNIPFDYIAQSEIAVFWMGFRPHSLSQVPM